MASETPLEGSKKSDSVVANLVQLHVDPDKIVEGTVVWVQIWGYPWWPAVIRQSKYTRAAHNNADCNQLPPDGNGTRVVELFNDEKIAFVPLKDMRAYNKDAMNLIEEADPAYSIAVVRA